MFILEGGRCRFTVLLLTGFICMIAASYPVIYTWGQGAGTVIHPVVRLEKPRYLLGESIRFWIGAEIDPPGFVPPELKKSCSIEIIKPDGTSEIQSIAWPQDGNPDNGWSGGWGFSAQGPGSYFLVMECAGKHTERLPLVVEKNEIFNEISAAFHFERSGPIKVGTSIPVIFSVTNDSLFPIRFPQRGVMMEGISVTVVRDNPAERSDFFYPWEKLRQFSLSADTYTWKISPKLPSITLEPGKHFEQRLSIEDAYHFKQPGNYSVTFSTVVSVLVGDEHGPFSDLCPIRVSAQRTEVFSLF